MENLPQIEAIDSTNKFFSVVYEGDEIVKQNKVMAYINQIGLINYNEHKQCSNGHNMTLKPVPKTDGWWWRCSPKSCQKTNSIRAGTFFFKSKILLWQLLLLIFKVTLTRPLTRELL